MTLRSNNEQSFVQQILITPVLVVICLVTMLLLSRLCPLARILQYPLNMGGLFLVFPGLAISFGAKHQFDKIGANFYPFRDPHNLVTGGLFHYSRNPMYLGLILFLTGAAICLGSLSPLAIVGVFFLIADRWYIASEEQRLSRVFGPAYVAYQAKTPRWI
ncbi:MAG: isoprenylcysteine carboxylmethyltransferase family protein [Anaerolineae bacterium]|nr:isoprenylcysteine carboxylmethyltransferase family protein [Anaerolineae bacterium]